MDSIDKGNEFTPLPLFSGCHGQTIMASLVGVNLEPRSTMHVVSLPDGDQLTIQITAPSGWKAHDPTALLVHGLCGSHRSSNVVRMTWKLLRYGLRVVRMNMRGCGSGRGRAKGIYHGGSSGDVRAVLEALKHQTPESPITLIGYSLGGNIVLKLAGELGDKAFSLFHHVIAISPPADLKASVTRLSQPSSQLYEQYFVTKLLAEFRYRKRHFKTGFQERVPLVTSLFEFDEKFLAPAAGFDSAEAYYQACSAKKFVPFIRVPCHILFAKDDPIIDSNALDAISLPACVKVFKTEKGGHLGFLSPPHKGFRWMDNLILRWVTLMLAKQEPQEKAG